MKIRLNIVAAGRTTTFEHGSPVIQVGRDPACDLAFEGDASRGVSRQHARIELSTAGATVADAGSSNGTLLNDRPIVGVMPLKVGDRIQLGYTGPTLTVLGLDLADAAPAPTSAARLPLPIALVGGGIAVALAVVLGLVWMLNRTGKPPDLVSTEVTQGKQATEPEPVPVPRNDTGKSSPPATTAKDFHTSPPPLSPPPPIVRTDDAPEVAVGRYLALPEWGPSVLLSRRGEAYPWVPLRPEAKVTTARTLLSLPGYRSEIALDSRVQLTLWGNVPPFCCAPPLLLESVVTLNAPAEGSGLDLDVTLEWGRIKFANRKESGPAQVRLQFQREVWDLTLPAPGSEVCVELWATLAPAVAAGQRQRTPVYLGLFTKGPATLRTNGERDEKLDLTDHTRIAWVNEAGKPLYREAMTALPGWWAKPPDAGNDRVADVMISLKDWAGKLSSAGDLVETIQKEVAGSDDPGFREQGIFFLEALDEASFLVNHLEDGKHGRVRRAAAHALRAWLSRGHGTELGSLLKVKVNSAQKANVLLELLHPFADEDLKRPDTYQKLIKYLDDDDLAVRELASWHLEDLVPAAAAKAPYNPAAASGPRHEVVAQWQKLVPPGNVPRRTAQ